jgi:hypothetical protein
MEVQSSFFLAAPWKNPSPRRSGSGFPSKTSLRLIRYDEGTIAPPIAKRIRRTH